jgi:hypothetical protein
VPVSFSSGTKQTNFSVDQTVALPASSNYRLIGSVPLVSDQETVVTIGTTGTMGFVMLDAIHLIPAEIDGAEKLNPPSQRRKVPQPSKSQEQK